MRNSNTTAHLRLSAILTALFVASASLIYPGAAAAFYNDTETSEENIFKAGSLDLSYEILNAANTNRTIKLVNDSSLDFFYDITVAEVPVVDSFCNNVLVSANGSAPVSVLSFTQASTSLEKATDAQMVYDFTVNPLDADYSGKTCTLEFRYEAFQENFNYGEAYSDTETDSFTLFGGNFGQTAAPITTDTVVLNEIYAHPNEASSTPYDIEWVELYNGTGGSVDVANWSISEMAGANTNQHEIVSSCPGSNLKDYMEPLSGSSTVISAGGLKVFKFCGSASYLNQGSSGDTVTLHMSTSSAAIDTYIYTSSQLGKSDARIPDGGTWVDPIPSPGESNMTTITVEDLEAEGWSDELIGEVLGIYYIQDEVAPTPVPTSGDGEEVDIMPPGMPDAKEEEQPDPDLIDDSEDVETELTKKDEGIEGESDENVGDKVSEDKVDDGVEDTVNEVEDNVDVHEDGDEEEVNEDIEVESKDESVEEKEDDIKTEDTPEQISESTGVEVTAE